MCDWTGFYIGIHGGYAWGDRNLLELEESDPPFDVNDLEGFYGGAQVGYNRQFGSWFVAGIEGEFSGGDIDGSAEIFNGEDTDRAHVESDWTGTIGGRIGASFCKNKLLAYAKGGGAFAHFCYRVDMDVPSTGEHWDADEIHIAPMVGAGLEYAINCHWSVKFEYKHLFVDDENVTGLEDDQGTLEEKTWHVDGDQDLIEAGLNFRF